MSFAHLFVIFRTQDKTGLESELLPHYIYADCSDQDPKYFVFPFYQMKTESIMKRKEKEKYFIRTFLSKLNSLY